MNSIDDNSNARIGADPIGEAARPEALPRHFGRLMLVFENAVFDWMGKLCPTYSGAYWNFYELSNGGFYMAPQGGSRRLSVENGFDAEMSADAAGITVCLFACSHLSFRYDDEKLVRHFHWLRDFALDHPEARLILAAID